MIEQDCSIVNSAMLGTSAPRKEKLTWFNRHLFLFGKVTFRRGKGLFQFAKKLATGAGKASLEMGKAVIEREVKNISLTKPISLNQDQKFYGSSKKVLKNTISVLKNNPKSLDQYCF